METALQAVGASIPSREAGAVFFAAVFTILRNVAQRPDEPKFRTIKIANNSFHTKVGQYAGGIDCLRALGFEDAPDKKLVLRLVWGCPDGALLRAGFEALGLTATRLGVPIPPIDFGACDGPSTAPPAAAGAASAPPSPPASFASAPVLSAGVDGAPAIRTFRVRDARKYVVGQDSVFHAKDGGEIRGRVMSLAPLDVANADAPHAAKVSVLVSSEEVSRRHDSLPAASSSVSAPTVVNLNSEARLAPSGWAQQKAARLVALRSSTLGMVPRGGGGGGGGGGASTDGGVAATE
jgi:hypothetical protein